jgi:hypothetical protein
MNWNWNLICKCKRKPDMTDTAHQVAWAIEVDSGGGARFDKPVEVDLPERIQQPRLVEVDAQGTVRDTVNLQLDGTRLVFIARGTTPAHTTRHYRLYANPGQGTDDLPAAPALIALTDEVPHEEQASYRITTQNATYYYHKQGAGFASMIDADGHDWLSYHPWGGSDGKYRGIPNLAHPENHFHPGGTGCNSAITAAGPLKASLHSWSIDKKWECAWDIFPTYACLTVLKVDHPYWFLYEGTPGGVLNEAGDYMVLSDGTRISAADRWEAVLPAPEWIYFGAADTTRILYLAHHEADEYIDSYWPMEHNMTVFGFGRNGLEKFMTRTPAHFTIGFAEAAIADQVIASAYQPLTVRLQTLENPI